MQFVNVNEQNVDAQVYEAYRAQARDDLTLFLKLRAEELTDGGFGLYLMLGAERGRATANFMKRAEPLFVRAFLNAASEFEGRGQPQLAEWTRRAVAVAKFPMFLRSEEDIEETLSKDCFKDILELVEVHSEECLVDNTTRVGMTDFIFSVCENSLLTCLRPWAEGLEGFGKHPKLADAIIEAMREQFALLAKKHFPDGKFYFTYMYLVVKRKPRV